MDTRDVFHFNSSKSSFLGVDCDEVYPGIVLGNGATVKKKDYLKKIGECNDTKEGFKRKPI